MKAIIASCGRKLTGLALVWEEKELWQVLELLETLIDIGQEEDLEDWT